MQSHPHSASASVPATERRVLALLGAPCPILAAAKAQAKTLKKWRKQERLQFLSSWCASLHALGFSF